MNRLYLLTCCLLAVFLIGCGGSSSGSSQSESDSSRDGGNHRNNDDGPLVQVERISLSGIAIKGLAINARVEAYKAKTDGQGFETDPFTVVRTNSQGQYQLTQITDYSGPIKIVLKPNTETVEANKAKLQCDAPTGCNGTNFGSFYTMPGNFELSVVIPSGQIETENDVKIANLSALTTFATSFIENSTSIGADRIEQGNTQIRAVFGLPGETDITSSQATNIAGDNKTGDQLYGVINAAFQEIAARNGSNDVPELIKKFSSELKNGQILIRTGSNEIGQASLVNVITQAENIANRYTELSEQATELKKENNRLDTAANNNKETDIIPPVVNAGTAQGVKSGETVTLTASKIFGTINNYKWQQIPKGSITINNATSTNGVATFTAPAAPGDYVFQVVGTDNASKLSDSDTVRVVVRSSKASSSDIQKIIGNYGLIEGEIGIRADRNETVLHQRLRSPGKLEIHHKGSSDFSITHKNSNEQDFEFEITTNNNNVSAEKDDNNFPESEDPRIFSLNSKLTITAPGKEFKRSNRDGTTEFESIYSVQPIEFINIGDGLFIDFLLSKGQDFEHNNDVKNPIPTEISSDIGIISLIREQAINPEAIPGEFHGLRWGTAHVSKKTTGHQNYPNPIDLTVFYLHEVVGKVVQAGSSYESNNISSKEHRLVRFPGPHVIREQGSLTDTRTFAAPVSAISSNAQGKSTSYLGFSPDGTSFSSVRANTDSSDWGGDPTLPGAQRVLESGVFFKRPNSNVDLRDNQYQLTGIEYSIKKDNSALDIRDISALANFSDTGVVLTSRALSNIQGNQNRTIYDRLSQSTELRQSSKELLWHQIGRNSEKATLSRGKMTASVPLKVGEIFNQYIVFTNESGNKIMTGHVYENINELTLTWLIGTKVNN